MLHTYPTVCPVAFSLDTFGDKWSLLILRDLLFADKRHFREFLQSREGIASNILADRLERFIKAGLVTKTVDPKNKSAAIYTPTKKALELIPIIFSIMHWGLKYNPDTEMQSVPFMKELQTDEKGLEQKILSNFAS